MRASGHLKDKVTYIWDQKRSQKTHKGHDFGTFDACRWACFEMANMYNTPITIIKVITLQEPTPRTKLQTFFCSSKSSPSCHVFFVSAKKKTSDIIEGNFVPGPKDSKMRADVVCYNCLLSTFAKTPTGSPRVCQVIFWMIYLGINVS